MARVTLDQLALKVGLEPKVIRRLVRKANLRSGTEQGKGYAWEEGNEFYLKTLEICEGYKKGTTKRKSHRGSGERPEKERTQTPMRWDNRGVFISGDECWGSALVPNPEDPTHKAVTSVYLGKVAEVMPILDGEQDIPANIHPLKENALRAILEGRTEMKPPEDAEAPRRKKRRRK